MFRVHTEANHSVVAFMGQRYFTPNLSWGRKRMRLITHMGIDRSIDTPPTSKRLFIKCPIMSLELYTTYITKFSSWIIIGMLHYLENLILFLFETVYGYLFWPFETFQFISGTAFYPLLWNFCYILMELSGPFCFILRTILKTLGPFWGHIGNYLQTFWYPFGTLFGCL